jgi:hypothetical protein
MVFDMMLTKLKPIMAMLLVTGAVAIGGRAIFQSTAAVAQTRDETRARQLDPSNPRLQHQPAPPVALPVPPPPLGDNGATQASAETARGRICAWINGQPIFRDEVMQEISPSVLREASSLPEPRRSERTAGIFHQALEGIIDQEVTYQDAVHRLETGNKKALAKLKKFASEKSDEQLTKIRESRKVSEEQMKDVEHFLRRRMERNLISGEYIRSRTYGVESRPASDGAIEKWYKEHLSGAIPLDEKTRKSLRDRLTQLDLERECRRITRELRNRATIEIVEGMENSKK